MLSFLSLSTVIGGERPRQDLQDLRLVLTNHQGCIYLLRRLTGKSQPPLTLLVPGGCAQCSVFAVVIFEGDLRLFFDPPPLWPPATQVRGSAPFSAWFEGPARQLHRRVARGGWVGPKVPRRRTRRRERIPTCLVVIRALVCRRSMAVGVISARMSPVGITVGSDHDGRLSLSARLLLTAIR